MTQAMWIRFQELVEEAVAMDPAAIVVTGVPGHFASGADITEFAVTKGDARAARASFAAVDDVCRRLTEAPVPTVAAVDGYALGAGLELLAACDLRLGTSTARFGIPAARLGITIGHGHIRRLIWAVGPSRALEMLLTARFFTAEEARSTGLLHTVAADWDELQGRTAELCERLYGLSPQSLRYAKAAVHRILADPALESVEDDAGMAIEAFGTDEFREGARAFLERRSPRFRPPLEDAGLQGRTLGPGPDPEPGPSSDPSGSPGSHPPPDPEHSPRKEDADS